MVIYFRVALKVCVLTERNDANVGNVKYLCEVD